MKEVALRAKKPINTSGVGTGRGVNTKGINESQKKESNYLSIPTKIWPRNTSRGTIPSPLHGRAISKATTR